MNALLSVNRKTFFDNCDHTHDDGTTAIIGFGPAEDETSQCLLCGRVFFDGKLEETSTREYYGIERPY